MDELDLLLGLVGVVALLPQEGSPVLLRLAGSLLRVDTEKAAREAEKDRAALLQEQGADANQSEQKVELIHKRVEG